MRKAVKGQKSENVQKGGKASPALTTIKRSGKQKSVRKTRRLRKAAQDEKVENAQKGMQALFHL